MITFLSLAEKARDNAMLLEQVKGLAAKYTDEVWCYELFEQLQELEHFLAGEPVLDMISWDITLSGALERLERLRQKYRQSFLLLIADEQISPMSYLRPGIMPTSLLLKPIKREELAAVTQEMIEAFSERFAQGRETEAFRIDTREGRQYIPYQQIYYIEARDKKIYIRTKQEEYGFYETIQNMEKQLPPGFCRCHRSYIANMDKVTAIKASQNLIELRGDVEIPLSRSYKKIVKDYYKNAGKN